MLGRCELCCSWRPSTEGERGDGQCSNTAFILTRLHGEHFLRQPESVPVSRHFRCRHFRPSKEGFRVMTEEAKALRDFQVTGERLQRILDRHELTQSQLAAMLNVDRQRVSSWIAGTKVPGPAVALLVELGLLYPPSAKSDDDASDVEV